MILVAVVIRLIQPWSFPWRIWLAHDRGARSEQIGQLGSEVLQEVWGLHLTSFDLDCYWQLAMQLYPEIGRAHV